MALLAAGPLVVLAACGPMEPPPAAPAAPSAAPSALGPVEIGKLATALAQAKVYDPKGNAMSCAPPSADCPDAPPDRRFLDDCRLAGFQIRQCGCSARCTGNVAAASRRYDEKGNVKECGKVKMDCNEPKLSSAFQDACIDKGHRVELCDCSWVCTGDPTK